MIPQGVCSLPRRLSSIFPGLAHRAPFQRRRGFFARVHANTADFDDPKLQF